MKTIQTLIISLFFASLHQNLHCITDSDVYCFGEDDTFRHDVYSIQSEYDKYRVITALSNQRLKKQQNMSQPIIKNISQPIAIISQKINDDNSNKNIIIDESPSSTAFKFFPTSWKDAIITFYYK